MSKLILRNTALTLAVLFSLSCNAQTELSGVTLGFGAGYNFLFHPVMEYSLSTDTQHLLHIDKGASGGFVISSIVTVRLGKVSKRAGTSVLFSQQKIIANPGRSAFTLANRPLLEASPHERWALNLAINLAEVNTSGLTFNKQVSGGLGAGYFVNNATQISAFLDVTLARQLRQSVVDQYEGKAIPKGNDVYTALDPADSDLFTTRPFWGVSLKLVYSLPNSN